MSLLVRFFRFTHYSIPKPLGRWIMVNPSMDLVEFMEERKKIRQEIKEKGIDPYQLYKKQDSVDIEDTDYLIPFITQL
jgi:hypothetical protein